MAVVGSLKPAAFISKIDVKKEVSFMIRHKASDETILLRFSHNQENHQKKAQRVKDDVGLRSIRGLDLGGPDDLRCDLRFRKRPKI